MNAKEVRRKGENFNGFKKAWEEDSDFRLEVIKIFQTDSFYVNVTIRLYLIVRATYYQDENAVVFLKKFYSSGYGGRITNGEVAFLRLLATKYNEAKDFLRANEKASHPSYGSELNFQKIYAGDVSEHFEKLWQMMPGFHREAMAKALLFLSMLE